MEEQPILVDTPEQTAITDFIAGGRGNLIIDALAGSGKTYSIIKSLSKLPQRSALVCAFNKRIAVELETKIPVMPRGSAVHVKTFHATGLSIIKAHYKHLQISAQGTEELINKVAGAHISFMMRRCAVNLLRMLKETRAEQMPPSAEAVLAFGLDYDMFKKLGDREISMCVEAVRDAYFISSKLHERTTIDFCDMVWAPVVLKLAPPSRYQAIFVDELQDISQPQLTLLLSLMVPNTGRFIGVGDQNQQIYGWRGSMGSAAWEIARAQLKATFLPLTTTWRCSAAVVKEANGLVPQLRSRPGAPPGHVAKTQWKTLPAAISATGVATAGIKGVSTFVLSRNNANLLDVALYLWRERVRFELNAGQELLEPLFSILDYKLDLRDEDKFRKTLAKWRTEEMAKAEKINATAYADRVEEQFGMLSVAATYTKPTLIKKLLTDILIPNGAPVLLSTVHKVKGLEADTVFLLKQTFARHAEGRPCFTCNGSGSAAGSPFETKLNTPACSGCGGSGKFKPDPPQEELNIEYVAITRAKNRLVWVDIENRRVDHRNDAITSAEDPLGAIVRKQLGIVSERDQLIEAATRFENGGMSRTMAEALADGPRGDHARDTMTTNIGEDEPDFPEPAESPTGGDPEFDPNDHVPPSARLGRGDRW